jgi:hypothetical protein
MNSSPPTHSSNNDCTLLTNSPYENAGADDDMGMTMMDFPRRVSSTQALDHPMNHLLDDMRTVASSDIEVIKHMDDWYMIGLYCVYDW